MHYDLEASEYDINSYIQDPKVFSAQDGYVEALKAPGLGIEVDEEVVRRVAQTTPAWQPKEFFGPDGSIREW